MVFFPLIFAIILWSLSFSKNPEKSDPKQLSVCEGPWRNNGLGHGTPQTGQSSGSKTPKIVIQWYAKNARGLRVGWGVGGGRRTRPSQLRVQLSFFFGNGQFRGREKTTQSLHLPSEVTFHCWGLSPPGRERYAKGSKQK